MARMKQSASLLVLLVLVCFQVATQKGTQLVQSEVLKLKIYVDPPKVLADNNVYESVFVQLQDSNGVPVRAQEDVVIHLSSSLTHIGSVDPVITIPSGTTYAVGKFFSTFTPGTTMITAAASGFPTVQESITTVGPVPSELAVYGLPPTLPADSGSYRAVVVQLQDANGLPAKAPIGDVNVTLSSSNIAAGNVDPFVVIGAGSTYAVATFNTTDSPGLAVITAIASGYASGQAQITTQAGGGNATKLKVYVGPSKVPADGVVYEQVAVQLQDASGKLSRAEGDVAVTLSSSNTAVGGVDESVTISNGTTYAVGKFYSTYRSGTTAVTAVATDYASGKESLSTVGPVPSKVAVYCAPSRLPADGGSYNAVMVQLQDSSGTPAKDSVGNVSIDLFSSVPEIGNVSSTIVIIFGKTDSLATFFAERAAGVTTITAITPGYASGQGAITTYLIDTYTLNVSVTANPANVSSGNKSTIRAYVTYSGLSPALGVTVKFTSDKGGNFTTVTDEKNGYYLSVFSAPNVTGETVCTILANVSKTGYVGGQGNVKVTVVPTVKTGSILVYIKDTGGSPVGEASVSSTSQPAGISSLSGLTDQEGLVSFNGVLAGSYTIRAEKSGYETKSQDIVLATGQATNCTIYLTSVSSDVLGLPPFVWIFIIVVVVIAVLAVFIVLRRRRLSTPSEPTADASPTAESESTKQCPHSKATLPTI